MAEDERDSNGGRILRLDGSRGLGTLARLTIIKTDRVHGASEETFEFPYELIDFKTLQKATDVRFILGYRIERIIEDDPPVIHLDGMGGAQ